MTIGSGSIVLRYDGAVQTTIPVDNSAPASGTVAVAGSQLTINPGVNLTPGKTYSVRIPATAILDPAGNAYAGIADDTTWSFLIEVTTPTVTGVTSTTANGLYGIGATIDVRVAFSEAVTLSSPGALTAALDTGALVTLAATVSPTVFAGSYTVVAGQNSSDLNLAGFSLASGETLLSAFSAPASLTLAASNLGATKAIQVDGNAPVLTIGPPSSSSSRAPVLYAVTCAGAVPATTAAGIQAQASVVASGTSGMVTITGTFPNFLATVSSIGGFGSLGFQLATGAAVDAAGNPTAAVSSATFLVPYAAPVEAVNTGLTTPVGGLIEITPSELRYTDDDSAAVDLVYRVVSNPDNGQLQIIVAGSPVALGDGDSFTQADLDAGGRIFYQNTNFGASSDLFVFRVSDETAPAETALALFLVTVNNANADPVVALAPSTTVLFVENGVPQSIASLATVSDDNASFPGGVLTIGFDDPPSGATSDAFDGGIAGDILAVADGSGIAVVGSAITSGGIALGTIDPVFNGQGGQKLVIALSATAGAGATPATVRQVLRNLTFANQRDDLPDAARVLRVRLDDGNIGRGEDTKQITTDGNNDVPVISAVENVVTIEGVAYEGTVTASDLDHVTLWYEVDPTAQPGLGTVTFRDPNQGAFTYVPAAGLYGADTFRVQVRDAASGGAVSTAVTVTVVITRLSDPPLVILGDPPFMVDEGGSVVHTVSVDPATVAGANLRFKLVGSVPPGATMNPAGSTTATDALLFWPTAVLPASGFYYDFGVLVIDTTNNRAGYVPILLKVVSPSSGGG